jgi:hypothetical protein
MTTKQYDVLRALSYLISSYLSARMVLSKDPQTLNEQIDNMIQQLETLKAK